MADERQGFPQDEEASRGGKRLPPPAFPPGQRAQARANHRAPRTGADEAEGEVPEDAFISPDEPIFRTGTRIADDAIIAPDPPFPDAEDIDPDDVLVTGMGDDPHLGRQDLSLSQSVDPAVMDLALRVGRLAEGLRTRGQAALKTTPDMNRFETTLRAYCVGYLAGQGDQGNG
jgi:hypothetical protein